ncbi:MAG: CRISPR-associated protein Cas4 [Candidatus Omnitrophica bacterium]|nr:CRISPR-associated protein Cas4 [Candidatus Omnitrophota bacterium]MCM8808204.1 CRISPR-associated protein Cas4 [Candidatus Omnitrophota bacterium]
MIELIEERITGTQVAYYIVCKRKLWLFSHQIQMEEFSDYVIIGKIISEESFKREKYKEVNIENLKIDYIKVGNEIIVNEVKKSRKLEESHIWQVKYYIYRLRNLGLNCSRGIIHYPKIFKKIDVEYKEDDTEKIEEALLKIKEIINMEKIPEVINKPYCRRCSYFELCYI